MLKWQLNNANAETTRRKPPRQDRMTVRAVRPHPLRPAAPICQFSCPPKSHLCVFRNISWRFLFDTNEPIQKTPTPPNLFKTNDGGHFYSIQMNDLRATNPRHIRHTFTLPISIANRPALQVRMCPSHGQRLSLFGIERRKPRAENRARHRGTLDA